MLTVPLAAVPSQTVNVSLRVPGQLARQQANITIRTIGSELYFSLAGVLTNRIIRDRQRLLVASGYRGFVGDFAVVDTQGRDDPVYTGLGARFQLMYFNADE
jgi:hypothetical protein